MSCGTYVCNYNTTSGTIIQLLAKGTQDIKLTGSDALAYTPWKSTVRKVTNYSTATAIQSFQGQVAFGSNLSVDLQRSADMVTKAGLLFTLPGLIGKPATSSEGYISPYAVIGHNLNNLAEDPPEADVYGSFQAVNPFTTADGDDCEMENLECTEIGDFAAWCPDVIESLVDCVTLNIGGQTIVKSSGMIEKMHREFTYSPDKDYGQMLGSYRTLAETIYESRKTRRFFLPLETFFMNKHEGLALPMVGLQFHTINFQVALKSLNDLIIVSDTNIKAINVDTRIQIASTDLHCSLVTENVYLDSVERDMLATTALSYHIKLFSHQIYSKNVGKDSMWTINYNANHPCSHIVVAPQRSKLLKKNIYHDFSGPNGKPLVTGTLELSLNQNLRFGNCYEFFTTYYAYYRAKHIPVLKDPKLQYALLPFCSGDDAFSWQNSGTLNLSRVDSTELTLKHFSVDDENVIINVFHQHFNVLNISAGMGGLQYSN